MNFYFYNIFVDNNVVDKSSVIPIGTQPTEIILKQPPDDRMEFEIVTSRDLSSYNYAYVSEFEGYYYLSDPIYVSNDLQAYKLTRDVLFSNVGAIMNLECMVERSESHANGWISDPNYVTSAKNKIITRSFPYAIDNDSICLITVG